MTSTHTLSTHTHGATSSTTIARRSLWLTSVLAGVGAAVATTAVAALALAAGISLEIDGEQIPLLGFANLTIFATVIGHVLAVSLRRWAHNPGRTFVVTTVVLTALSLVPDLVISASLGTKAALIVTHLVAAVIVIPAISARLPRSRA